jgi:hypothetical protein
LIVEIPPDYGVETIVINDIAMNVAGAEDAISRISIAITEVAGFTAGMERLKIKNSANKTYSFLLIVSSC